MCEVEEFAVDFAGGGCFAVQYDAAFLFEVVEHPHVVVAGEVVDLHAVVGEFGDFSEESCEAPWHGLTVFEPEVEHVSEEVYGGGLVLDAVEEVDESAFLCTAAADGLGAQVGIAEEVDRFHQVGEGVCGWVGNAFRGVAVRWLVCGSV